MARFVLVFLFVAFISVLGLAIYKLVKSKLSDVEKLFWVLGFIFLNILAAIPFIIFHDYFLTKEKRA